MKAAMDGPLIEILTALFPESSKTTLRSWIREGRITINGVAAQNGNEKVNIGQEIFLLSKSKFAEEKLRLIYEDNDFVAIEKPVGLLSVATAFEKEKTAFSLLKAHYRSSQIYIVHRLDQETSGVMLFALSEKCYQKLKLIFEKHEIERSYCAIIEGCLPIRSGTWKSYLYEDSSYFVHSTENPTIGRLAITHYEVQQANKKYSRLNLFLETGRKNQIRVHCQENGHPIVGDKKYGSICDPIKRLCLHAQSLSFINPMNQKWVNLYSPPPESFKKLVGI